jgi:hypothetical protein
MRKKGGSDSSTADGMEWDEQQYPANMAIEGRWMSSGDEWNGTKNNRSMGGCVGGWMGSEVNVKKWRLDRY